MAFCSITPHPPYLAHSVRSMALKFLVTDDTVEVHPYILVTPGETNPVIGAIENVGDYDTSGVIWAVFNGITMPVQTTPVIPAHTAYDFQYSFQTPNLPKGTYPCIFYVGRAEGKPDDSFTQPAIRITDVIIDVKFVWDIKTPNVVALGQKVSITVPMKVKKITGAERAIGDVWVVDFKEWWDSLEGEDVTVVDDRVLEAMHEHTIGEVTHTKELKPGDSIEHVHTFTIPRSIKPGKHRFEILFGKYNEYFLQDEIFSGYIFDVYVLDIKSVPEGASFTID